MTQYEDLERQMLAVKRATENPDAMKCPKCNGQFFELVSFNKYKANYSVILGQAPVQLPSSPTFYALKCVCGEIFEPLVVRNNQDVLTKQYDQFIDTMMRNSK